MITWGPACGEFLGRNQPLSQGPTPGQRHAASDLTSPTRHSGEKTSFSPSCAHHLRKSGQTTTCRADLMAATGQFSCPPAGSLVAISGQFLVAAVSRLQSPRHPAPVPHTTDGAACSWAMLIRYVPYPPAASPRHPVPATRFRHPDPWNPAPHRATSEGLSHLPHTHSRDRSSRLPPRAGQVIVNASVQ